ncbi:MAG: hypothetical protein ACXAD7_17460 [Candidatus Kariarchaeaceae archaeon]|jgi:rRNA-processing protein FCF1
MIPLPIFLDTNVLLHAADMGININAAITMAIDNKYRVLIHPYVEHEVIQSLSDKSKLGRKATLAIQLSGEFESFQDESEYKGADHAIMSSAEKTNGCVFTLDKELIDRCKARNIPVISTYKKGRFHLIGHID